MPSEDVLGFDIEPFTEDMQIVGESEHVGADGSKPVAPTEVVSKVVEFDARRAYGLHWVPIRLGRPTPEYVEDRLRNVARII